MSKLKMRSYYMTKEVMDKLDKFTAQQKKADPRMSKSRIVELAIEAYIKAN